MSKDRVQYIMYEDSTLDDAKNSIEELQEIVLYLKRQLSLLEERLSKEYSGRREEQ
tara:strand:- start:126 stop:293 length:168 start_codon:yes stop_codon:yes gene_type:complete